MKKALKVLIAVFMVACLMLTMTACKTDCDKGNHDLQLVSVDEATCTTAKVEHYKCANCDHTEDKTVGVAADHDYTGAAWTASATDSSKHERTCTRQGCGYKDVQNHTPVTGEGTPADCTTPGMSAATTCSDCNATITPGTVIPALDHDFDATIEANVSDKLDATCTEDGHMTVKCSRCDVTKEVTLTKTGHSLTYDVTEESHTEKCSKCTHVGTATAHTDTDGKCVCGGKLYPKFAVTDYATIKASVSASKVDSDIKYFAIGIVKEIVKEGYGTTVILVDTNSKELQIYFPYNCDGTVVDQKPSATYSAGDVVVYYGYANFYKDVVQLKNAWLVQVKGEQQINMAGLAATELAVPENVSENFTLPTIDGATITWEVTEGTAIAVNGNNATVTPSNDGAQTVKIKATITVGTDSANKTFVITVAKAGEKTIVLTAEDLGLGAYADGNGTIIVGWSWKTLMNSANGAIQMKNGSVIGNTSPIPGTILKVELIWNTSDNSKDDKSDKLKIDFGTNADYGLNEQTITINGVITTYTYTVADGATYNYIRLTHNNKGAVYLTSIKITYAVCEHETTTDVPATGATCTTPATIAHKLCSTCGAMLDGNGNVIATAVTGEANGHSFGDIHEEVAPTCSAAGNVAYYHCTACNKDFADNKGNKEIEDVTIAIDATKHNYVYSVDSTDPTKHIGVCSYNNEHKTEAAAHTATGWVTTDSAKHWKECTVCKSRFDEGDHDFTSGACECGKSQDSVTFGITPEIQGYEGQTQVIAIADSATTGTPVTFTVTVPDNYELTSVKLVIGEAAGVDISPEGSTYTLIVSKDDLGIATSVKVVVTLAEKTSKTVTVNVDLSKLYTSASSGKEETLETGDVNVEVKITNGGTNSGKVYIVKGTTIAEWRIYASDSPSGQFTISSTKIIKTVIVTFEANDAGAYLNDSITNDHYTSGTELEVNGTSVTFTATGKKNCGIRSIVVVYEL